MADIKPHEYSLLNEIAQDALVTQASLSINLGIAVGSVNWYIKRLIQRGWIKVSRLDRTRLKYDLTPEGMKVFSKRALLYARDSLKVYGSLRQKAKKLIGDLKEQGVDSVYVDGDDDIYDILRLTCIEAGIHLNETPSEVILKVNGQDYRLISKAELTADFFKKE